MSSSSVVADEKGRVLRLFIEIPRAVVRAVLNKHRHNLAKAEGGEESDSMSEEDEDVDALDTAVRSMDESQSAQSEQTAPSAEGGGYHRPVGSGEIELHPSALKTHAGGAHGQGNDRSRQGEGGSMSRLKGRRNGVKRKRGGHGEHLRRTAAGRAFQHSRNAFWSSLLRFSILWLGIAAYFSASFAVLWSVTDWSVVRVSNVEAASRRAAFLPYVQLISMYDVILPDAEGRGGLDNLANGTLSLEEKVAAREADYTSRASIAPVLEGALTELVALDEALVYGSSARQTVGLREDGSSDRQIVLTLENTCVAFAGEMKDNCTKEEHGVLTHGLQNAIRTYTETVREMAFERDKLGVGETLSTAAARLAERLEALYLRPAARESLEIYTNDARTLVSQVITGAWVEAFAFIAIAMLLHFFLFRTMLSRLDLELRETRAMLLLVPTDVAQRVPAIRTFMTKLVEDMP